MNREDGAGDSHAAFVFRNQSQAMPSDGLEQELSATILRIAKEKFRKRDLKSPPREVEPAVQSIEDHEENLLVRLKPSSSGDDSSGEEGHDVRSDAPPVSHQKRRHQPSPTFLPVVSTDDDLSYSLLRPPTRSIIGRLDSTLTVLHNARVAGLVYLSDSSENDGDQSDTAAPSKKRRRSSDENSPRRERKPIPVRERRVGRPRRIHAPKEGETEREMRVRVAREKKQRIPTFSDDGEDVLEEEGSRKPSRGRPRGKSKLQQPPVTPIHGRGQTKDRQKKLSLWGLRDWSDVIGAAALAGFSPAVIERATQRCSNLFHENMKIRTLAESLDEGREETTTYVPERHIMSSSEEEQTASNMDQIRSVNREPSVKLEVSSSDAEANNKGGSSSRQPRCGTPPVSTAGMLFCPHEDCSRAVEGFTRRANLTRHLQRSHGEGPSVATEDENSSDEIQGAVHIDGFLKPIKARKGWRGADTAKRSRGRRRRQTGRYQGAHGGKYGDELMKSEPEETDEPWI